MRLQMIRYGLVAGFSFLAAIAVLGCLGRPRPGVPAAEADISDQIWQVLAEARRIVEESA